MESSKRLRNFVVAMTRLVEHNVYEADTGEAKPFVSGYSNLGTPNFWGHCADSAPLG